MKNLTHATLVLIASLSAHVNASDCDGNGISDADEIASGRAFDSNGNGVPDGCEGMAGGPVLRSIALNMGPTTCGWWTTADCGAWYAWVSRSTDAGPWANGSSAAGTTQRLDMQLVAGQQTIYVRCGSNGCGSDYWGPVTKTAASRACDLNSDGQVDGFDLGILLSNWGACPN